MKNAFLRGNAKLCIALSVLLTAGLVKVNAQSQKSCDSSCKDRCSKKRIMTNQKTTVKPIACKLTSKEMQERKTTVIAALKKEIIERKELPNGYSYKFKGSDDCIDRIVSFVKTERLCCGFFTFNISVTEDYADLELTGPEGAKEFINTEIGL